jgi:hypothetical protein
LITVAKRTTDTFPAPTLNLHYPTHVINHPELCDQLPSRRHMLKIGMSSPIALTMTRPGICANAPSARPHASMRNDIRLGLETTITGRMRPLTIIGPMTVASATSTIHPGHHKVVVITIKDLNVEAQLKEDVVVQRHQEVSGNVTVRAEPVVECKHASGFTFKALFWTGIHYDTVVSIHGAFPCCFEHMQIRVMK